MSHALEATVQVDATVTDILPRLGIAYLTSDDGRCWAVTRATRGSGLDTLSPGDRLCLTLRHHETLQFAAAYGPAVMG